MPELQQYDPMKPEALDEAGTTEYAARYTEIDAHIKYYDGQHKKQLKVRQGQPDDNVVINLVQKIVDQSTSMLFGEMPDFETGEEDETAEEEIEAIFDAAGGEIFLSNLSVMGSLSGHCYIKIVPEDTVKLSLLDARHVSVFWKPDDKTQVMCYRIQWGNEKKRVRQDIVNDGRRWLILNWKQENGTGWKRTDEVDIIWPYPFAPIVDWQNLPDSTAYYGRSDLYNPGLNDAVNFVASNINRILKYHAHPRTFGTGVDAQQITETAVDGFWAISNPEAKISNLEMSSDLGSSMAFLQILQGAFYSQHRAVDMAGMKDRIGQLTNFGLKTLYKDALDKLDTKRMSYGRGLMEVIRRCGVILGRKWDDVNIDWENPLPESQQEEVAAIKVMVEAGLISKQTASERMGNDWAREQTRMADEKQSAQADIGAALLGAMSKFGNPQTGSNQQQPTVTNSNQQQPMDVEE